MLLLSPRHENFAQLVAGGASAAQACRAKIIKMAGWYAPEVRRIEGLDWIMELMGNIRSGSPVAATAG